MRTPKLHDALLIHRWSTGPDTSSPAVALVSRVWGDRCVNAGGFNPGGTAICFSSLRLLQEDDTPPGAGPYAVFASTEANPNVFQA